MNESDFWGRVKSRLKAKGITHENAAQLCGFNFNTFHSWINKSIIPSAQDVFRLAGFLGVSVEFLFTGKKSDITAELEEIHNSIKAVCKQVENLCYKACNDGND